MIYKYNVENEPCSIESYPAHFIKLPLKNPSSSFQRPHPNLVSPFLPIFFRILQYLSIAKSRPTANIYASKSGHRKKIILQPEAKNLIKGCKSIAKVMYV